MTFCCDPSDLLKKAGVDRTSHRVAVLGIIQSLSKVTCAKEILSEIRVNQPIDKVTLYRILELFVKKSILRRIISMNGTMCYEIICSLHLPVHPHFVCRKCGDVECLREFASHIRKQTNRWKKMSGAQEFDLRLEGLCTHCKGSYVTKR